MENAQAQVLRVEVTESFERALDNSWRRLREKARAQWENQFAGSDPSDACVSVRIIAASDRQSSPVPCGGFLAKPVPAKTGKVRPSLA
jgi:hypothetical protein